MKNFLHILALIVLLPVCFVFVSYGYEQLIAEGESIGTVFMIIGFIFITVPFFTYMILSENNPLQEI